MKRVDIKTGFVCNNKCLFCVQADNRLTGNRSFEEIKKNLEEVKDKCTGVVLTGGEVTIRTDFLEVVKYAKKLGYETIQIQSNGRMFSSIDFCKKTIEAGATEFAPALHGYTAEQHDYLTNAKSFNQTLKGIYNLKSLGAKVIMNTVILKPNYKDLPKIANLLCNLKVDQFQLAFVHAIGNAWDNYEEMVPKMSETVPYIKEAIDIGIKNNIFVMVEAVPFCLMEGYEKHISENYIPETVIRGVDFQNTDDYKNQRMSSGKKKFPQCKNCKYDQICEGVWKEYPEKFGEKEFIPVIK